MELMRSIFNSIDPKDWKALASITFNITLIVVLALVVYVVISRLIRGLRVFAQSRTSDTGRAQRIETLGRLFRRITGIVLVLVAGTAILNEFGISVAPIIATAGVAGLAIGFAAQSLIKDYFHGFFILIDDQLRLGEVVTIAGVSGAIESITLRFVRLRDFEGHVHFIPNGEIKVITNRTRDFAQCLIEVGVAYRENADEALAVMREVGQAMRADDTHGHNILEDTELVGVENWADSAVILRCRLKVKPGSQWGIRREFLKRLKAAYDAKGIEIPFPHLTLYPGQLKDGSAPALRVANDGNAPAQENATNDGSA